MVVDRIQVIHHFLPHRLDAVLSRLLVGQVERLGDFSLADALFEVKAVDGKVDQIIELLRKRSPHHTRAGLALSLSLRELPNRLIQITRMSGALYISSFLVAAWCFLHYAA
jgi:hypothetical protein